MKPIYAFIVSGLLAVGGIFFVSQAQQLKDDYYGGGSILSDCQLGSLGNLLGFQFSGVNTSGCDNQRREIESMTSTSNALFAGAAASLGFGLFLQLGKRRGQEANE
jgi:hypothetical protein